jgi:molybdate transport system regulatory protein
MTSFSPPRAKPTRQRTSAASPALSFHMRIMGDEIAVGPGKIALVEAIERTGSLTAAARSMDMSYRRAWLLLDELNRSLRKPAVLAARGGAGGGGSEVTDSGRRLVELYRRIEAVSAETNRVDIRSLMGLLAR